MENMVVEESDEEADLSEVKAILTSTQSENINCGTGVQKKEPPQIISSLEDIIGSGPTGYQDRKHK